MVIHDLGKLKPKELEQFLSGQSVSFEREVTLYEDGQRYFKSKIELKERLGESGPVETDWSFKDGKSKTATANIGDFSTDLMDNSYTTGVSNKVAIGDFTASSNVTLSSNLGTPAFAFALGYGGGSVEIGSKEEDGYKVAYIKQTQKVQQKLSTLTSTNEAGVKTIDNATSAFKYVTEHPIQAVGVTAMAVGLVYAGIVALPLIETITGLSLGLKALGVGAASISSIFLGGSALFDEIQKKD